MKRIISVILCMTMLMSLAILTSSATEPNVQLIPESSKNVISFKTDKETYTPGSTVTITATAEQLWGDLDLTCTYPPAGGQELQGAYGMATLNISLVFDTDDFTYGGYSNLARTSQTLKNFSSNPNATNTDIANSKGFFDVLYEGTHVLGRRDTAYGALGGSGDLFTATFTINSSATPGTYTIYADSLRMLDPGEECDEPVNYNNTDYAPLKNVDFFENERDVEFSNITINVSDGGGSEPDSSDSDSSSVEPPADPMAFKFSVADGTYAPGQTVEATLSVEHNSGIDYSTVDSTFSFNNTVLKLTEVTTPVEEFGDISVDYESANKLGTFEELRSLKPFEVAFEGTDLYEGDGVIMTLKFEVLNTAEAGTTTITGKSSATDYTYPEIEVTIGGDHTHSFNDIVTPSTCVDPGYTTKTCDCGLTYRTNETRPNGHVPDPDNVVVFDATCEDSGSRNTGCKNCDKWASTETIQPKGHEYEEETIEATCFNDGYTHNVCTRCAKEEPDSKKDVVNAFNHMRPDGSSAFGEEYVRVRPTTNSTGSMAHKCDLCGTEVDTSVIDMLAVKYGDCNMDGELNLEDVVVMLQNIAKWEGLYFSQENGDVDLSGSVNSFDVTRLMRYLAGWNVTLGPQ